MNRHRSILDELLEYTSDDQRLKIEERCNHAIAGVLNVFSLLEEHYEPEQADELKRKMLNAIRTSDIKKFNRKMRECHYGK